MQPTNQTNKETQDGNEHIVVVEPLEHIVVVEPLAWSKPRDNSSRWFPSSTPGKGTLKSRRSHRNLVGLERCYKEAGVSLPASTHNARPIRPQIESVLLSLRDCGKAPKTALHDRSEPPASNVVQTSWGQHATLDDALLAEKRPPNTASCDNDEKHVQVQKRMHR